MAEQTSNRNLIVELSTLFGVGRFPFLQGTVAAAAGCVLYYLLFQSNLLFIIFTVVVVIVSVPISSYAEKFFGVKDPKQIVIDDFAGMCLALIFVPHSLFYIFSAFIFFRIFDGLKVYPINRIEKVRGGWGVSGDDIVAGIYANLLFHISSGIASLISSRGV